MEPNKEWSSFTIQIETIGHWNMKQYKLL